MTRMTNAHRLLVGTAVALTMHFAQAQDRPAAVPAAAPQAAPETPTPPGKALLAAKCFQCHTDAMFRDQRQDRRAWEATLYRMVGRGALWTRDEIRTMADYLATDFGPKGSR
ncbi:MAG TPA: hypothetical protein VFC24_07375 [Casimicrobiaceae bacterium]|nr:hypothetical protein [Casimicrobiaceae bacterium]